MQTSESGSHVALDRMLFFSDGVFAIAITLLVIEIKLPPLPRGSGERDLAVALLSLIPLDVGFIVSFFLVGQTWIEHHRISSLLTGFDLGLLWWNLLLLFFVAFMPFATAVLSEHIASRVAVTLYALAFSGLGFAKVGFWRRAVRCGLVSSTEAEVGPISRRVWATPLTAVAVAGVSAFGVPFAFIGFMLIPLVARLLQGRTMRLRRTG